MNLNNNYVYVSGANAYGVVMISQANPSGTNNTQLNVAPSVGTLCAGRRRRRPLRRRC